MDIKYKNGTTSVDEALGIPQERVDELEYRFRVIVHEFFRPTKDEYLPSTDQILKSYIALAENEQELVFALTWLVWKPNKLLYPPFLMMKINGVQ